MVEAAHGEILVKRRVEAVAEVRRFVRLALGRWDIDDYAACLVASELVTNAVRYANAATDDELTVRLSRAEDGSLWLEVQDSVCEPPRVQQAGPDSESGRGLFIVDQLTRHWGVRPLAGKAGKVVFAVFGP